MCNNFKEVHVYLGTTLRDLTHDISLQSQVGLHMHFFLKQSQWAKVSPSGATLAHSPITPYKPCIIESRDNVTTWGIHWPTDFVLKKRNHAWGGL